jgi:Sulfotransferase family
MTMPNFLIVGAQKAGTTSLHYYLKQHPQIYMSPRKEPHFFEGMHWDFYRPGRIMPPVTDLADYQALFEGVTDEKAIGEASASYLYSPKAPTLIKRAIPDARLIAILRNPADRAYSNFLHCVRGRRESIVDFAEALRIEEERIKDNWGPLWHYKQKGFYYAQVKRYLDTFGRELFKVWLYEDLRTQPLDVLRDVLEFLEVDDTFVPNMAIEHNTSALPRNKTLYRAAKKLAGRNPDLKLAILERCLPARPRQYVKRRIFVQPPPFPAEIRERLLDTYTEDILKLQELIGRDLSPWLEGAQEQTPAAGPSHSR